MPLTAQVALVTGASRGIGLAIANRLAAAGASVALLARDQARVEEAARALRDSGRQAMALCADVADYAAVEAALRSAEAALGPVNILVNNAGVIKPIARLADSDPASWRRAFEINLAGAYHAIRAVLPGMRERGGGTILNLSSGAAKHPLEGWSHYCASKAALLMLTACTQLENADRGLRVIGLSPGTVATDMMASIRDSGINPVSRLDWSVHIPPDWVGQAAVHLCGPAGNAWLGTDFPLRSDEARRALGLPLAG